MKLEINPTPSQIKWFLIALLILAGVSHDELILMVGI